MISHSSMMIPEETDDFTIFCNNDIIDSDDVTVSDEIIISDVTSVTDDLMHEMGLYLECSDDSQYVMPENVKHTAHSILGQNVHIKISFPKVPDVVHTKRYRCTVSQCARTFAKNHFLKQHLISKHGKRLLFNCHQCNFETNSNRNLGRHVQRVHKVVKQSSQTDQNAIPDYCLLQCPALKPDKPLSVQCTLCNHKTNCNRNLVRHVKRIHGKRQQFNCVISDAVGNQRLTENQQLIHLVSKEDQLLSLNGSDCVNQSCSESIDVVNQEMSPVIERGLQQIDVPRTKSVEYTGLKHTSQSDSLPRDGALEEISTVLELTHNSVESENSGQKVSSECSMLTETAITCHTCTSGKYSPVPLKLFRVLPAVVTQRDSHCDESLGRTDVSLLLDPAEKVLETTKMTEKDHDRSPGNVLNELKENPLCSKCTVCNLTCVGSKPFKNHSHKVQLYCTFCSTSFSKESVLEENQCQTRTVTEQQLKVRKCPHPNCDFSCILASDLDQHEQTEHKHKRQIKHDVNPNYNKRLINQKKKMQCESSHGRQFVCSWTGCGKRFRDSFNLRTHFKTHTGAKPTFCNFCDFICIQKSSMDWHLRKKHPRKTKSKGKRLTTKTNSGCDVNISENHLTIANDVGEKTVYVQIENITDNVLID